MSRTFPGPLDSLVTRARLHQSRDECEVAERLYVEALHATERDSGADSPRLVPILEALAGLLWYVERHDEAREYANRAIELKLPRQPGSSLLH